MYHKVILLKHTVQWFGVYSELGDHHHYRIPKRFHPLNRNPTPLAVPPVPSPPVPASSQSTFCLRGFTYLG